MFPPDGTDYEYFVDDGDDESSRIIARRPIGYARLDGTCVRASPEVVAVPHKSLPCSLAALLLLFLLFVFDAINPPMTWQ